MSEFRLAELLDILNGRIHRLEEDIKGWEKPVPIPPYDSDYSTYIQGAIDQARDEQKFLFKVIMQVEFSDKKDIIKEDEDAGQ
jgi:hypothetical protein